MKKLALMILTLLCFYLTSEATTKVMIITPRLVSFTVVFGPPSSTLSTPLRRNHYDGLSVRGGSSFIRSKSQLNLLSPTAASVVAGSVAGAIGTWQE